MEFLELLKEIQGVIPPEYADVSQAISAIFPWLMLAMALLLCFCGHKVHQLWAEFLFLGIGILIGIVTGAILLGVFPGLSMWVLLLPPLLLGVLGAVFAKRLHKLQLFFVNATLVYAALPGILGRWLPGSAAVLLGLAAAIIVGLLAAKYKYLVTIITTAIAGATSALPAIFAFFNYENMALLLGLEVVFALCGMAVQFLTEPKKRTGEKKATDKGRGYAAQTNQ